MDRLTRLAAASLLSLSLAACGSDEPDVADVPGSLVAEVELVDFGAVLKGGGGRKSVRIMNRSRFSGTLAARVEGPYRVVSGLDGVGPGTINTVELEFQPQREDVDEPGKITFSLDGVKSGAEVVLAGKGTTRKLVVVPTLSFTSVPVGVTTKKTLELRSESLLPLVVRAQLGGRDALDFRPAVSQVAIAPKGTASIEIDFTPHAAQSHTATLELRPCGASETCDVVSVSLLGTGLGSGLSLDVNPMEFPDVPVGSRMTEIRTIENTGDLPVWISTIELRDGPGSPFSVAPVEQPRQLAKGETIEVAVTFAPLAEVEYAGTLLVEAGLAVHSIALSGRGGKGKLELVPEVIDYGMVPSIGDLGVKTVRIRDVVSTEDPGVRIERLEIQGDVHDAFNVIATPTPPAAVRSVAMNAEILFTGTSASPRPIGVHDARLVIIPTGEARREVPLRATVVAGDWCDLEIDPPSVRFGLVRAGATAERTFVLRNKGDKACTIADFSVGGSPAFEVTGVESGLKTIPSPGEVAVTVRYTPARSALAVDQATIRFRQTHKTVFERTVAVTGAGTEAELRLSPSPLVFAAAPLNSDTLRAVDVHNAGPVPLTILGTEIVGPSELSVRESDQPTQRRIASGAQSTVQVGFRPRAATRYAGDLLVWVAGAIEPFVVPLSGQGSSTPCGAYCEDPVVSCPATQNSYLQRPIELAGARRDARSQSVSCAYEVTAAPAGSVAAPVARTECRASFQPDVAGDYTIKLTGTDTDARSSSCAFTVKAPAFDGLWIESRWAHADDVDLHLFLPDAGRLDRPDAWRSAPYDCWERAPRPSWDETGLEDDPAHESGERLEVVRIASPVQGQNYQLGIHWPTTASGRSSLDVETMLWCGGERMLTETTTLDSAYQAVYLGSIEIVDPVTCIYTPAGARTTVLP